MTGTSFAKKPKEGEAIADMPSIAFLTSTAMRDQKQIGLNYLMKQGWLNSGEHLLTTHTYCWIPMRETDGVRRGHLACRTVGSKCWG